MLKYTSRMHNLVSTDESKNSIELLKKLQQQEDTAYERELIRRREQELIDEAIARELQEQFDIESNISNRRRSSNNNNSSSSSNRNQSPPSLPNKPLAYGSFALSSDSASTVISDYSSTFGSVHNSSSPPTRPPQSRSSSSYTSIHQPPLHTPLKSNTMSSSIPVSRPTSMPTPMLNPIPNYIATPKASSVPASTPYYSSRIPPSSSTQSPRFISIPVFPTTPGPFIVPSETSTPSNHISFTRTPIIATTQPLFQNNISNNCKDNNVPPFRIPQRAATQPPLVSTLNNTPSNLMNERPVYSTGSYQDNQSSISIGYIGSNYYQHPSQRNSGSSNVSAYHVVTSDPIPLSETLPTNNRVPPSSMNQHQHSYQKHRPIYSDSFFTIKPDEKDEETNPFSDQFIYQENNNGNILISPYKLNKEVQKVIPTKTNISSHKKSISKPPKLQSTEPQITDDNYGYYKENIKADIPASTNSDERHITIASINSGLRAWIRIHPQDTGKSLAERIHIVGSYKTQKVLKLTSQSGRNIPLDNAPIFKDWDDLKEFKEGETWKVEWGPMPCYIDIINEGKQFMKQVKKSFKT